jgi:transketolase
MFARRLEKLIETQHEEVMSHLRQREEEMRERKEEFERLMEASERRTEETREFNREILLRNEKVYTSAIVQLEENTEQTRANTKAVLSVLDRLENAA